MSSGSPDDSCGPQILGAPGEPDNGLSLEPGREIGRKWPAQVRTAKLDPVEAIAGHRPLEPPPLVLDLRQLRHASRLRPSDADPRAAFAGPVLL